MKFIFNQDILSDLNLSKEYEWLEYNGLGAYASSTITGLNTRREHGLLNVPFGDNKLAVLLAKLEESVFIGNHLYELSTNHYLDSTFPDGYKYIERFELNPFPTTYFNIEGRLVKKTVFLLQDKNILIVRYELKNQGTPIKLIVKPFLAVRESHSLATEIQGLNTDSYLGQNFVRWAPKTDMPELNVHFNRGEFIPATLWYHNFSYYKDSLGGNKSKEDLFNPGFFQVELKAYQALDLFMSSEEYPDVLLEYEHLYRKQKETIQKVQESDKAAQIRSQLHRITSNVEGSYPLSFLKSKRSTRELVLTLPALFKVCENKILFKSIFKDLLLNMEKGLLPNEYPGQSGKNVYEQADTPLWFLNVAYEYLMHTKDIEFFSNEIIDKLKEILVSFTKGTFGNIYTDKNGLIFSGDKDTKSSWMPLSDSTGSIYRYGFLLEVNALWYNALKVMEAIYQAVGKNRPAAKFAKQAAKLKKNFPEIFLTESGNSLYDYVGMHTKSNAFRVNQIIPLALPFSILDEDLAKKIFVKIDKELITPYGMRVLSENLKKPKLVNQEYLASAKDAIYNEAIWPWTILLYVQASLNYKKENSELKTDLNQYFQPVFELLDDGLIGFFPEAIYLNQHIYQFGIHDFVLSLANIAYAFELIK